MRTGLANQKLDAIISKVEQHGVAAPNLVDDLKECTEENDKLFGKETPKIDGKQLLLSCVSKDFSKMENTDIYTYYHFILENNDDDEERFGVWANGILTETPSKKQFIGEF